MPAPMSSSEPGEAWVWGDFVLTLQVRPKVVDEVAHEIVGMKSQNPVPLEYPFAMSAFYRKDRNPHGPSSRPILVATLERANYSALLKRLGPEASAMNPGLTGMGPVMQCLFTPEAHLNFGGYHEPLTAERARNHLLRVLGERLPVDGEPVKIGDIAAIHGHPNTGWPAGEPAVPPRKPAGCLGCVLILIGAVCARFVLQR